MDVNENHEKIVKVIEEKGPRLPVQIARELEMNSLFVSAFLSEMVNSKRIKVSHLKVGGSPLYFLEGQEEQLSPYQKYLHPKEGDAFLRLKKYKVLKDNEQHPSIRVALRSIRDFAFGFKMDEDIFWRFFLTSEEDVKEILEPNSKSSSESNSKPSLVPSLKKKEEKTESHLITREGATNKDEILELEKDAEELTKTIPLQNQTKESFTPSNSEKPNANEFKNPFVMTEEIKIKKEKPRSEFVLKTIQFIKNKGFIIAEEKEYKPKEYHCIVKINSELGPINFLTVVKNKKTITETDLRKILSDAQSIPLPALIMYTGDISKKSIEFVNKYSSVLKVLKIEA